MIHGFSRISNMNVKHILENLKFSFLGNHLSLNEKRYVRNLWPRKGLYLSNTLPLWLPIECPRMPTGLLYELYNKSGVFGGLHIYPKLVELFWWIWFLGLPLYLLSLLLECQIGVSIDWENLGDSFFSKSHNTSGLPLVSWDKITQPKSERGLEVHGMHILSLHVKLRELVPFKGIKQQRELAKYP